MTRRIVKFIKSIVIWPIFDMEATYFPERRRRRFLLASYMTAVCVQEAFIGPVLVAFYTRHVGMSFLEMTTFFSIIMASRTMLEIPAGILSDRFGRKLCLISGESLKAACMLWVLQGATQLNTPGYVAPGMVWGLGAALASGNLTPLLHAQADIDQKANFVRTLGYRRSFSMAVFLIATVASGYLAAVDLRLPMIVDIALSLLYIVACGALLRTDDQPLMSEPQSVSVRGHAAGRLMLGDIDFRVLLPIALVLGIVFSCERAAFNLLQPQLLEENIPMQVWGWLVSLVFLSGAVSAYLFGKTWQSAVSSANALHIAVLLSLCTSAGLLLFAGSASILAYLCICAILTSAISPPLTDLVLNRALMKSGAKTTAFSVMALVSMVFAAAMQVATGWAVSVVSPHYLVGMCSMVSTLGLMVFRKWLIRICANA